MAQRGKFGAKKTLILDSHQSSPLQPLRAHGCDGKDKQGAHAGIPPNAVANPARVQESMRHDDDDDDDDDEFEIQMTMITNWN